MGLSAKSLNERTETVSFFRINHPDFTTEDMMVRENQISVSWGTYEDVRNGLSACDSREELAAYLAQTGIEFREDWQLVEFEGDINWEEDDLDADKGVSLVFPTKIISTEVIGDGFMDEIFAAFDAA